MEEMAALGLQCMGEAWQLRRTSFDLFRSLSFLRGEQIFGKFDVHLRQIQKILISIEGVGIF